MKQTLTAKLKLKTTPEQFKALRQTQLAYRDALNSVSQYAFEHGKMSSGRALQRDCYDDIRLKFCLPAQMACNVPRQVSATYKGLWTKVKKNAAARKAGLTKKRYKGLDKPPKYVSPTLTYNYQRDYSFKTAQRVSVLALDGRVVVPYTGYSKHNATYSKWSFAELQAMIAYKALSSGSMAIKVDAHYTSKSCPICGHTSDENRPRKGLLFVCQNCHYTLHADLVGARNITMRTLLIRQDWEPRLGDDEAKAARLQRYAELRWSLDTSPRASAEGD